MPKYNFPPEKYPAPFEERISQKKPLVGELLEDRLKDFRTVFRDIGAQIVERKRLKDELIERIDAFICALNGQLYDLELWPSGSALDARRGDLERQLVTLEEEKRSRETEWWRDIAPLREEFRRTFTEYRQALRRANIINLGKTNE